MAGVRLSAFLAPLVGSTGHGLAWYPASLKTALYRGGLQSGNANPLGKRLGHSICGDKPICSSVPILFGSCRPSNIPRDVRAVVVNSVNGVPRGWPLSHMRSKRFKRSSPLRENGNPPAAVRRESGIELVGAPLNDLTPRPVKVGSRFAMGCFGASSRFLLQAAATLRWSFSKQIGGPKHLFSAAITSALPPDTVASGVQKSNRKTPKPAARQVLECVHG